MKVSDRTTNLLKNYANINQSLEFRAGKVLRTVSPLNTILASVEIEEDFPQTFSIYELSRFLGTLDLFNNPELDFTDKELVLSMIIIRRFIVIVGVVQCFKHHPIRI